MPIAQSVAGQLENASWIRRMFEEGAQLKRERGADKIFDFTLGNPDVEPPEALYDALERVVKARRPGSHGYMPNPGIAEVRELVASKLTRDTGLPFEAADVFMTVGSAGACNVILKSLVDPGDEVILLKPYFSEYPFYLLNHHAKMVAVDTDETFLPDIEAIRAAVTPRTKAIFVNTPNNPSGRVYPAETLEELGRLVASLDHEVLVISDEPYKHLVYDGKRQAEVASYIGNTVVCNSWSKSQGLPGERIGYLALSPRIADRGPLRAACSFSNRVLGFINAPALWQLVELEAFDAKIDFSSYQRKRDQLCAELERIGYDVRRPEGAFYVFLKTPIADDVAFVRRLAKEGVLTVPGSGFGRPGYIRISLTVPEETVARSIPGFEAAFVSSRSTPTDGARPQP